MDSNNIYIKFYSLGLEKLNDYVFFEIFSYLSINDILLIKQVNKRFYFLVESYLFKINQVMVHANDNCQFQSCMEHRLTKQNLINSVNNTKQFFTNFLIKLIRLEVLSLCFLTIYENDLIAFTQLPCVGTTLKHLEINNCEFKNFYLTAEFTYENFFKKLGNKLEHLIFYKNSSYLVPVNYLLENINIHLTNLHTLILDLKQYQNFKTLNEHLKNCTKLNHLSLHGIFLSENSMVDRFIAQTIDGKCIEYLNLRCLKMNQNNLFYTIHNCPNLKVLKFAYDYTDDNRFGRQLITNNSVFKQSYFRKQLQKINQKGMRVNQFTLATIIASLKHLEELHLTEIFRVDVINIDSFILYLYHYFKRNNIRRLLIANYEIHLMNLKAFCYVTKKLQVLCLNELTSCSYKSHDCQINDKLTRTVNESFIKTFGWLHNLTTISLNQCNFNSKLLESLLFNQCQSKVANFSFLHCKKLEYDCIDKFFMYARSNSKLMITAKLDEYLVEQFEIQNGPLVDLCPNNLQIIPL